MYGLNFIEWRISGDSGGYTRSGVDPQVHTCAWSAHTHTTVRQRQIWLLNWHQGNFPSGFFFFFFFSVSCMAVIPKSTQWFTQYLVQHVVSPT